jgi:hypothetical protein
MGPFLSSLKGGEVILYPLLIEEREGPTPQAWEGEGEGEVVERCIGVGERLTSSCEKASKNAGFVEGKSTSSVQLPAIEKTDD